MRWNFKTVYAQESYFLTLFKKKQTNVCWSPLNTKGNTYSNIQTITNQQHVFSTD